MLSKYSPVQGSELGLTDIRTMPFLSRNSYHWKCLALSPALHVTGAPTGLHGAVWVAQEEARGGRKSGTHLEPHLGPIRKLTPIWFGEGGVFSCLVHAHNEGDIDLQFSGLKRGREGSLGRKDQLNDYPSCHTLMPCLLNFRIQEAEGHRI